MIYNYVTTKTNTIYITQYYCNIRNHIVYIYVPNPNTLLRAHTPKTSEQHMVGTEGNGTEGNGTEGNGTEGDGTEGNGTERNGNT